MRSELLDLSEQLVHVTRVLVQEAALQHQCVVLAGSIPNFAQPIDPLIGVDTDQRTSHRCTADHQDAQVRDLQVRRLGVGVDVLWQCVECLVRPEAGAQNSPDAFQE